MPGQEEQNTPLRRMDLRLVPSAVTAWLAALAGAHLPAEWTAVGAILLAATAAALLLAAWRRPRKGRSPSRRHLGRRHHEYGTAGRSIAAALALACLLGVAVAAHTLISAGSRSTLPPAGSTAARETALVQILVTSEPRKIRSGAGGAERWVLGAQLQEYTVNGTYQRHDARILVVGSAEWQGLRPGQRIRTAGKIAPARPGQAELAVLAAGTRPLPAAASLKQALDRPPPGEAMEAGRPGAGALAWAAGLRKMYREASAELDGDPAGLLPGMVIGDTDAMDEELLIAMRDVGATHLTAVSGANCSLILGLLVYLARTFRLGRAAATAVALCGLAAFVVLVGPEPSVLRAAVMGAIGLLSLAGGRPGRGLGFLCLAVSVLLVLEPSLGGSPGFLLSVLATLGIILLARPLMKRAPAWLPAPAAAALAVPLSAQLFCAPVIVALQPQFTTYSLLANIAMSPFVAPVTVLGTVAVPVLALHDGLASLLLAAAAVFAGAIAGIARFLAGVPGAVLPWPEGPWGMATMAFCSALNLLLLWLAAHPGRCLRFVLSCHGLAIVALESTERWFNARQPRRARRPRPAGSGSPSGHGRLEACKTTSGRKYCWLLPRPRRPRPPRQIRPVGGTFRRPP